jgi:hypothetical protein
MLPVVASTNTFSFQTPLVNTALPGDAVARVPFDTVAPSPAGVELRNNTQGSGGGVNPSAQAQVAAGQAAAPDAQEGASQFIAQLQRNIATSLGNGVQATFVAQLAAQDITPEVRGILTQYEKLVANANVKYKPSNAAKPEAAPAGVFGRLLQAQPPPSQIALGQIALAQAATDAVEAAPSPLARIEKNDKPEPGPQEAAGTDAPPERLDLRAINAYASSAGRVAGFTRSNAPIEGISAAGELA